MAKPITIKGRGSWFGGGNDPGNPNKTTASGVPDSVAGVAIRPGGTYMSGQPYLGGYWRITGPNGKQAVLKQTDIGPNENTGRRVDITPAGLKKLGYSTSTFPTDSQFTAEYLGKSLKNVKATGSTPGKQSGAKQSGGRVSTQTTVATTAPDNQAARRAAVYQYLQSDTKDPGYLASLFAQQQAILPQQTTTTQQTTTSPITGGGKVRQQSQQGGWVAKAKDRADAIDAKKLPYLWGGGHQSKVNAYKATPLDCSGAVSAVLGIDPRVSGAFETWGRPGDGGSKGVTIYANAEHVLMKIDGKFFGTSGSNPGGGAGWIKQEHITPEYLRGFTVRHSARR